MVPPREPWEFESHKGVSVKSTGGVLQKKKNGVKAQRPKEIGKKTGEKSKKTKGFNLGNIHDPSFRSPQKETFPQGDRNVLLRDYLLPVLN